jgi:hypothetical protein
VNAAKSTRVPKAQRDVYDRPTALTNEFCREHLNEDAAELSRSAIAALCRKRPTPLRMGRLDTWACAVIYSVGQANFLFNKTSNPSMTAAGLCAHFKVAVNTGRGRAKHVQELIGVQPYDFRWAVPETIESMGSLFWTIEYNGLLIDARDLPRDIQEAAFEQGVIPYVHADKGKTKEQIAQVEQVRQRYDAYREISTFQQTRLGKELFETSVWDMAIRLGVIEASHARSDIDFEDIAPALDCALYRLDEEGRSAISRDLEAWPEHLDRYERSVFDAMSRSRFSVFELARQHAIAGVVLRDLFTDEELWLVDRGLETSAPEGLRMALRLIRPDDFWMTTGGQAIVTDEAWTQIKKRFARERNEAPHPDQLAQFIFQAPLDKSAVKAVAA